MKNALLLGIVLSLAVLSLSTCSGGSSSATVLSTWGGGYVSTFGVKNGTISGWKFMSDGTTTGVWKDSSGTTSISINAEYTLDAGTLTIEGSGTATSTTANPKTSPYTLSCSGSLGSATGSGTYSTTFSAWNGAADRGTWTITRQ